MALNAFHGKTLTQRRDYKVVLARATKAYGGTAHMSTHFQPQH